MLFFRFFQLTESISFRSLLSIFRFIPLDLLVCNTQWQFEITEMWDIEVIDSLFKNSFATSADGRLLVDIKEHFCGHLDILSKKIPLSG